MERLIGWKITELSCLEYKNVPSQSERSLELSNKNRLGESKTSIWDQNIDLKI